MADGPHKLTACVCGFWVEKVPEGPTAFLPHSSSHSCQAVSLRKARSHHGDEELRSWGGQPLTPPFLGQPLAVLDQGTRTQEHPWLVRRVPRLLAVVSLAVPHTGAQLQRELPARPYPGHSDAMTCHTQPPPLPPLGSPWAGFLAASSDAPSLPPALHGKHVYFCGAGDRTRALVQAR